MCHVVDPLIVQQRHERTQHQGKRQSPVAQNCPGGEADDRQVRRDVPEREEQQVEPAGFDMMVVVQTALKFQEPHAAGRRRMEKEAVGGVFGQIEQHGAREDRQW